MGSRTAYSYLVLLPGGAPSASQPVVRTGAGGTRIGSGHASHSLPMMMSCRHGQMTGKCVSSWHMPLENNTYRYVCTNIVSQMKSYNMLLSACARSRLKDDGSEAATMASGKLFQIATRARRCENERCRTFETACATCSLKQ